MVFLPVSASWTPLGSDYFRKHDLYILKWKGIQPLDYQSCVSSFGGVIGLADDSGGFQKSFNIFIFSASGQNICKIPWNSGELVRIAWSSSEELICVRRDGRVFLYSMFGLPLSVSGQPTVDQGVFTMGNEAQELKILSCQIFHGATGATTGIAVLTRAYRFYVVSDIRDPKVWRTMELVNTSGALSVPKPTCWTVTCLPEGNKCFIFAAVETGEIYKYSRDNQPELIHPVFEIPIKEYRGIVVSPDSANIALISENGFVQIAPLDFKGVLCEVDSGMRSRPSLFCWCGSSAIACCDTSDAESLLLLSLNGDTTTFTLNGPSIFGLERDGIRIISSESHDFLSPVPDTLADIFRIGSMSPGALLNDAFKEFEQSSSKASEYIQILENSTGGNDSGIEAAVRQCVDAAGDAALQPVDQTVLLKSAAFGKNFRPEMDSSHLVNMCRILRVLNLLRAPHIAIPLTFSQLKDLSIPVLLDRLIARRQWPLAIKVAEWLQIPQDMGAHRVLITWAMTKIENRTISDEETANAIRTKFVTSLGSQPGRAEDAAPYAELAQVAAKKQRKQLALKLLTWEPCVERQIRLLLTLKDNEKALQRAVQSCDPQIIYFVIFHLRDTLEKKSDLDFVLRKYPTALSLYKRHCRLEAPLSHLSSVYEQEDDHLSLALLRMQTAANSSVFEVGSKIDALKGAENSFNNAGFESSAKLCEEQCRVLRVQEDMEEKYGQAMIEMSVRETIVWLFENGEKSRAESLKKEWKIADKQFWWWKLEGLTKAGQWNELDSMAVKAKKTSPGGLLPFVDACIKCNCPDEAARFLAKMTPDSRILALIKLKDLEKAAQLALEQKREDLLNRVLQYCGPQNRGLTEHVVRMKEHLRSLGS